MIPNRAAQNHTHLLALGSVGQESGQCDGFSAQDLTGQLPGVSWGCVPGVSVVPGEESTPKLVLVVGRIQLLTAVRWGPPSISSLSPAGHSQLLGATHIPCPVALSFPKVINRNCLAH